MGLFSKKKAADADVGSADIAAGDAATARAPSDGGALHSTHSADKNPFVDSSGKSASTLSLLPHDTPLLRTV